MRRLSVFCFVFAVLLLVHPLRAQDNASVHQHAQGKMIDGLVHPELIPDLTAYRLYLVAVSLPLNPTEQQKRHQAAQLAKLALEDRDRQAVVTILETFNSRHENLIRAYNERATAANARGDSVDAAPLLRQLDQLAQTTHDSLKSVLSAEGWAHLDGHVQSEKKQMKLGVDEEAQ